MEFDAGTEFYGSETGVDSVDRSPKVFHQEGSTKRLISKNHDQRYPYHIAMKCVMDFSGSAVEGCDTEDRIEFNTLQDKLVQYTREDIGLCESILSELGTNKKGDIRNILDIQKVKAIATAITKCGFKPTFLKLVDTPSVKMSRRDITTRDDIFSESLLEKLLVENKEAGTMETPGGLPTCVDEERNKPQPVLAQE